MRRNPTTHWNVAQFPSHSNFRGVAPREKFLARWGSCAVLTVVAFPRKTITIAQWLYGSIEYLRVTVRVRIHNTHASTAENKCIAITHSKESTFTFKDSWDEQLYNLPRLRSMLDMSDPFWFCCYVLGLCTLLWTDNSSVHLRQYFQAIEQNRCQTH